MSDTTRADLIAARRDELLTVKEFSTLVRMHERSVWRRIRDGRQRGAYRFCGQWRIDLIEAREPAPV